MTISRRGFIRVVGGGTVVAAAGIGAGAVVSHDPMPAEAVAPWRGPDAAEADVRRRALSYAILAPNPHNMQSWMVDLGLADVVTLYVDPDRLLPETDPYARQIMIGHGTFLELLDMAAAEVGYRTETVLFPEGPFPEGGISEKPVARIRFMADAGAAADPLFAQVLKRRSTKEPYEDRVLAAGHVAGLAVTLGGSGLPFRIETDPARVEGLRLITEEAMAIEMQTPRTLMESIERTRLGGDEIKAHRDGISLHGRFFWWARLLGVYTKEKAAIPGTLAYQGGLDHVATWTSTAAAFAWITTPGNSRADQIAAGRAYVRFNLKATEVGVAVHPMSQVLQEYPEMAALQRRFLADTATPAGYTVQMLARMGYAEAPPPSPRRPLADLVVG